MSLYFLHLISIQVVACLILFSLFNFSTRFLTCMLVIRAFPHHGYDLATLLKSFYDGLSLVTRANLDAGAGGRLLKINLNDVEATIEEVAKHSD